MCLILFGRICLEVPRYYLVRSIKKSPMIIKKNQNWNDRMNYFIRNLNDYFKQYKTLYIEEKHIANKEKTAGAYGILIHQVFFTK